MKKQLILSLALISSFALKAENAPETLTNPEIKPLQSQYNNESNNLQTQETKQRKEINFDIAKISAIIEQNLPEVSEKCESVTITFKIDKDSAQYNKDAWNQIVLMASNLIKDCNSKNSGNPAENTNKTIEESHKFLVESSKLTGIENKVYGSYGVYLNIPADYANNIFAPAVIETK